jgi:hypothetical protein
MIGTRGRSLLGDVEAQWSTAAAMLIDSDDFDRATQEAALMLLLQANGVVDVRQLVTEVADVIAGSGWRESGNGAPPDERGVGRGVAALIRRCELWSLLEEGSGSGSHSRLRLSEVGRQGGYAALRHLAMRPRLESDT